jgi:hypothetical protein
MAERAAHLVDHVLPDVPVRQWVLSLPHRMRYLLAWDHELRRAVSGVAIRAVLGFLRRRACRDGVADGRSGAVVVVQRFGGALNLNIHLHALVLDGVFTHDGGAVRFHPVARLTHEDVVSWWRGSRGARQWGDVRLENAALARQPAGDLFPVQDHLPAAIEERSYDPRE